MRDVADDRDMKAHRADPVQGRDGRLVDRAQAPGKASGAACRELVIALSLHYVPRATEDAAGQAFEWYLEDAIRDQVQAIVDRAEAGDEAARAVLALHRQPIEPRGWTLYLQGKEVSFRDGDDEICFWGELGRRADQVLKRIHR